METNNVSQSKKDSILKSLAIAGLLAILLLVAWLAIQLVHLFPGAFTSLASLAEGVNQYQETIIDTDQEMASLVLTSNTSLINTGDSATIEWSKVNANGSYAFAYACSEGVSVEQVTPSGARAIPCDTNFNVGDVANLTIAIDSEKNRYADVPYEIFFLRTSESTPRAAGSDTITVVNTDINNQFAAIDPAPSAPVITEQVDETEETVVVEETEPESVPVNPTPSTPAVTPGTPTFTQEFSYTIPVSDPNGVTDLGVNYVGVGEVINRSFVAGPVSTNNSGAIQFVVKNFGTKTSNGWEFSVTLPNGSTYESATQEPLKPNERAVLTIGFPAGGDATHTFTISVDESSDRNSRNDSFSQRVSFAE